MKPRFYTPLAVGLSLFIITLSTALSNPVKSQDFDVQHYNIHLQPNFNQKTLAGYTEVTVVSHQSNLKAIPLDLLSFSVDSVIAKGQPLSYQHNDTLLDISLNQSLQEKDTLVLAVYYQGDPAIDPSGWGGFYFRNDIAFNLGVGFQAKPHNYGRTWFPCQDNFTDRAFYDFHITTKPGKKAFCNGLLEKVDTLPNGNLKWHWAMEQSIPTYLASMAVGPYATVRDMYDGINGKFPIVYAVKPGDSNTLKNGFTNIPKALEAFENFYGPHQFSRVGYVAVPFNGGAMEHATNIAFPEGSLSKTRSNERLWAHELSHHWWGDLVTTHKAEEMWINEGWATFSEFLFLENAYGRDAYQNAVKENHYEVLTRAHEDDNGYRPLVPVPHSVTYGTHSYQKGADVVHTLRTYLGDDKFKKGVSRFLQQNAFEAVSSRQLRDSLTQYTGVDLEPFFENWVFNPGFPHFALNDVEINQDGSLYTIEGQIQQKLHEAPDYYSEVPLTISAFNNDWDTVNYTVKATGAQTSFSFRVNFEPAEVALDVNSRISDAKTTSIRTIKETGDQSFNRGDFRMVVNQIADSALAIVEKSWVRPDRFKGNNPGFRLSSARYWEIKGVFPDSFKAKGKLEYNKQDDPDELNLQAEDSFRLMYRPYTKKDWQVYPDYNADFRGRGALITIKDLHKGQYCFAKQDHTASINDNKRDEKEEQFFIFPNPSQNQITVRYPIAWKPLKQVNIYDVNGRKQYTERNLNENPLSIEINDLDGGQYILEIQYDGQTRRKQFILKD